MRPCLNGTAKSQTNRKVVEDDASRRSGGGPDGSGASRPSQDQILPGEISGCSQHIACDWRKESRDILKPIRRKPKILVGWEDNRIQEMDHANESIVLVQSTARVRFTAKKTLGPPQLHESCLPVVCCCRTIATCAPAPRRRGIAIPSPVVFLYTG